MSIQELKDWLVPVSAFVTLISVAISSSLALRDYRLKLKAEARLRYSSQVEVDIRLLKLFTEIMTIAHARSGYFVSEKAIEKLFEKGVVNDQDLGNLNSLNQKLEDAAILTLPVGIAAQDAAIAAISTLANRHEVLRSVAIQALESIRSFKPEMAEKYLKKINHVAAGSPTT